MNYIDKSYVNQNNIIKFHLGILSLLVIISFWKINDDKTFYENCGQNYKTQDVLNNTCIFFSLGVYTSIL